MGQKTRSRFRLGVIRGWSSNGIRRKLCGLSARTFSLRNSLEATRQCWWRKRRVERAANKVKINIHTARPGVVIGAGPVLDAKKDVQALTK